MTATARHIRIFADAEDEPEELQETQRGLCGVEGLSVAVFRTAVKDATDRSLSRDDVLDAREFIECRGWDWLRRHAAVYGFDTPNERQYTAWLETQRREWKAADDERGRRCAIRTRSALTRGSGGSSRSAR